MMRSPQKIGQSRSRSPSPMKSMKNGSPMKYSPMKSGVLKGAKEKNAMKSANNEFWKDMLKSTSMVAFIVIPIIIYVGAPKDHLVSSPPSVLKMLEPELFKQIMIGWSCVGTCTIIINKFVFGWFGTFQKLGNPQEISPEQHLHAAVLQFACMLVIGAIITYSVVDPEKISDSMLKKWYGYNNLCIVLDFPPLTYINPIWYSLVVYHFIRHNVESIFRLDNLKELGLIDSKTRFFGNFVLGLVSTSICIFCLCVSISPDDDMFGHTIGFIVVLFTLPLLWWTYYSQMIIACRLYPEFNETKWYFKPFVRCFAQLRGKTVEEMSMNTRNFFVSAFTTISWLKCSITTYALLYGKGNPVIYEVSHTFDVLFTCIFFIIPLVCNPPRFPQLYPNGQIREVFEVISAE